MMNLDNFDWGWMNRDNGLYHISPNGETISMGEYHKKMMTKEIFEDRCYEIFFQVEENDVVVDIGSSVGPFTYSILDKKPKHVFCIEPSESEFKTLVKNVIGFPVTPINKGISSVNSFIEHNKLFGGETHMESITFNKFIDLYSLDRIDFMKIDCEGGEYDIFNKKNFEYIKNNVKKISGEWHLSTPELKNKFIEFREIFLSDFKSFYILSVDGVDIKWDLWNDHFIDYYNEVLVYIDNRS